MNITFISLFELIIVNFEFQKYKTLIISWFILKFNFKNP